MNQNVDTICYPTSLQHGMLHHSQLDREAGVYVEQFSCVLVGPLNADRFERAWAAVVQRHDVLKAMFIRLQQDKPLQVIRKRVELPFHRADWSDCDPSEQQRRFDRLLIEDRSRGFDPSVAPLMRVQLVQLGGQRFRFLWTYHHAILDGWSMPIVLDEVFRLYAPDAPKLPALSTDYRHYLAWLRRQDIEGARAYWKQTLRGYREPLRFAPSMAPALGAAPAQRRLATASVAMPAAWVDAATRLCRTNRITINTLCQGAWSMLLGLYADRDDIVYGVVVSGRPSELAGAERMAGLFINTLPARVKLAPEMPLMAWLRELQSATMQSERYAYSPLPEVLQCSEVARPQTLFDSIYVFENYPGQAAFRALARAHGLELEDIRALEETNYSLALLVLPGEALQLNLTYDTTRFAEPAMTRLLEQYRVLLDRLLRNEGALPGLDNAAPPASGSETSTGAAPPASSSVTPASSSVTSASSSVTPASSSVTSTGAAPLAAAGDSFWALVSAHAAAGPGQPACLAPAWQLDYRDLQQRVAQAMRTWRDLGYAPGDRVLLLFDDDAAGLVMLLSGLACGIDCLLAEPNQAPDELLAAGAGAWGSAGLQGCVSTRGLPAAPAGLRNDVFEPRADGGISDDAAPVRDGELGGCALIGVDPLGAWTVLRYSQRQLVQAAAWFVQAYPVLESRDVPLAGSALGHGNVWTTLMALAAGLTLHPIDIADGKHYLRRLEQANRRWHSVRLNGAQTRRLADSAGANAPVALSTERWLVDAASLTPDGARRLNAIDAGAQRIREWRWPANSLPHASAQFGGPDGVDAAGSSLLGEPAAGVMLGIVDSRLRPAAIDAYGRVAVRGRSVPSAMLRRGMPDPALCLPTADGSMLLTDLQGWSTAAACHAELPQPGAALNTAVQRQPIEAALAAQTGVTEVALVEHLSAQREWQHTVYFVASAETQPVDLRERLQAACKTSGVADAAVVQLLQLPRDERGIDRVALLRGDVQVIAQHAQTAPRDELETTLHAIWCELLKRDRIGIEENYFDLGGQSLLATVMLFRIEEQLGVAVDMETLLAFPSIAGLAQAMRSGQASGRSAGEHFASDAVLPADIVPPGAYHAAPPEHILLTGATGFLGVHLLADLLQRTQAQVHCLVRATSVQAGTERLVNALKVHGLWNQHHAARLVAVPGELDRELFGLSEAEFSALAARVDVIYHNGAMVNFVYPYAALKQVNVAATADVLRLACLHKTKPVHYVSTVGVLDRKADSIPETLAVALHDQLLGGYEQSKWVAEQLLCQAAERGVPVSIYRPSRIVGHSRTGRLNTDDLFCRLIKGIVLFGKAPRNTGFDNMLPVDVVSAGIVSASLHPAALGHAVHVVNAQWNSFDQVIDFIESQGHPIERLDYPDWVEQLAAFVKRDPTHPLAMLIPVLRKLDPVADPSVGRQMPIANANLKLWAGDVLATGLRPLNDWWRVYFSYLYEIGYLPPAPHRGEGLAFSA